MNTHPLPGLAPKFANIWKVQVRHPLEGKPLTEQLSNEASDAYMASVAPEGWIVSGKPVQGRTRTGKRVICAVFERFPRESNPWELASLNLPTVVTLQ